METKLIMLPQPILVATVQNKITLKEAEPKILDLENQIKYFRICIKEMQFERTQEELSINEMYLNYRAKEKATIKNIENIRKNILLNEGGIIAGIEGLPKLDLSLVTEEIGWVDVEKLAINNTDKYVGHQIAQENERNLAFNSFIDGFKANQSINDKNYTKSDVIKAMEYALENQCPFQVELYQYFIDDLSKPKEYQVEVEMEVNQCDGCISGHPIVDGIHVVPYPSGSMVCKKHLYDRPKITNNSIKVTKVL